MRTDADELHKRFLSAVKCSSKYYKQNGGRLKQKLKPLHGWIQSGLRQSLGDDYQLEGISKTSSQERSVEGWAFDWTDFYRDIRRASKPSEKCSRKVMAQSAKSRLTERFQKQLALVSSHF